jgi:hypothetical protein
MSQCLNHHIPWDVSDIGAVEACAFFLSFEDDGLPLSMVLGISCQPSIAPDL